MELKDENTLRIRIHEVRFVGPKENAAGVLLTVAGLSLPILLAAGGSEVGGELMVWTCFCCSKYSNQSDHSF